MVVCEIVPGGPQPVPVQHGADQLAVGEEDGRRPVPGLHHGGVIPIHVPPLQVDGAVVFPRLGDRDHHGQRELHAVHHQKLYGVVQHGRVGAVGVHHREHAVHVSLQYGGGERLLAGEHSVHIAADGVDLAVVQQETVGMGPLPGGSGVGGEAGVDHGDGGDELFRLQIQPPLKGKASDGVGAAAHEALPDTGHAGARRLTQNLRTHGHVPPAQERQALLSQDDLEHFLRLTARKCFPREKEHPHGVIPRLGQRDAELGGGCPEKAVGDLRQDPYAVARLAQSVFSRPMLQLFHDTQGVVHGPAAFSAEDVHHGADPAGVVFGHISVRDPLFVGHRSIRPFLRCGGRGFILRWLRSWRAPARRGRSHRSPPIRGWASRNPLSFPPVRDSISQRSPGRAGFPW